MSGKAQTFVTPEHLALATREPTLRAQVFRLAGMGYSGRVIADALGVSLDRVRWHLRAHKERRRVLHVERLPKGAEFLSDAAGRTGFDRNSLANVLRWHGVTIHRANAWRARMWALRADIDAAVAAWLDTETPNAAARRLGIKSDTIRRWLEEAGHKRPARYQQWRLPSAVIDAVVAERLGKRGAA